MTWRGLDAGDFKTNAKRGATEKLEQPFSNGKKGGENERASSRGTFNNHENSPRRLIAFKSSAKIGARLDVGGVIYDSQIKIRRISVVFAQSKSEDQTAAEFGNVRLARGGAETRVRSAIF